MDHPILPSLYNVLYINRGENTYFIKCMKEIFELLKGLNDLYAHRREPNRMFIIIINRFIQLQHKDKEGATFGLRPHFSSSICF
jgi:hypothetical protein